MLEALRWTGWQHPCTAQVQLVRRPFKGLPSRLRSGRSSSRGSSAAGTCRAVKSFELGTVFSDGKEANWLAPEGGSKKAKGVILFMHGFAQGPNAYYENLKGLADAGFLVIAPVPPFAPTPKAQQRDMVDWAAHFHSKLVSNSLTGLPLSSSKEAQNIGLLGHSVGAGLATYVAYRAAAQQPFKAVMYMAPQTQVVEHYDPKAAIDSWPQQAKASVVFGLQYGLKDDLAPPNLSRDLAKELRDDGLALQVEKAFENGTHVGFEDQVVLGDAEITSDILPWLNPLLLWLITALSAFGVPFLPLLLGRVYRARLAADSALRLKAGMKPEENGQEMPVFSRLLINPQDIALLEQQAGRKIGKHGGLKGAAAPRPDGIGPPEEVDIASAEASLVQYIGLLTVAVAAFVLLASQTWEGFKEGDVHWSALLGTLLSGYFTYKGAYYLMLQNYVDTIQRPQSREVARDFFTKYLAS